MEIPEINLLLLLLLLLLLFQKQVEFDRSGERSPE